MSTSTQPQLRTTWDEDIERELWGFVQDRAGRESLSCALREFAEKRGLSVHTARAKYYRMRRRRNAGEDGRANGDQGAAGAAGGEAGLRSWRQEEQRLLMRLVEEETREGRPLSWVFARAAAELNRSPLAVRSHYYRLLAEAQKAKHVPGRAERTGRERREAGPAEAGAERPGSDEESREVPAGVVLPGRRRRAAPAAAGGSAAGLPEGGAAAEERLLSDLAEFFAHSRSLDDFELRPFMAGLACMAGWARRGLEGRETAARMRALEREKETLQARVAAYEKRFEELREQYATLDFLVNEFTNLSSIEKVTALGDFGRRLKYQVDRFGLVVKAEWV